MAQSFYNSNVKCSSQPLTVTTQMKNPMEFWKFAPVNNYDQDGTRENQDSYYKNQLNGSFGESVGVR